MGQLQLHRGHHIESTARAGTAQLHRVCRPARTQPSTRAGSFRAFQSHALADALRFFGSYDIQRDHRDCGGTRTERLELPTDARRLRPSPPPPRRAAPVRNDGLGAVLRIADTPFTQRRVASSANFGPGPAHLALYISIKSGSEHKQNGVRWRGLLVTCGKPASKSSRSSVALLRCARRSGWAATTNAVASMIPARTDWWASGTATSFDTTPCRLVRSAPPQTPS